MKRLFLGIMVFLGTIILVLSVFLARIYFGVGCGRMLKPRPDPLQTPQEISSIAPQIKLVRELNGIVLQSMILEDNIAFIVGSFDELENDHLLRFNTVTTQEEWQVCRGTNVMAVDETHLYVYGRGFFAAYDRETGTEVWRESVDRRFSRVDALKITPFGLFVEAGNRNDTRFYLLDPGTGENIDTFQSSLEWLLFQVEHGSTGYVVTENDKIVASGDVHWQANLDYEYYPASRHVQLIVEDAVILAYQVSPTINYIQITALDKTNGDILWEQDMYITSNHPAIIDNDLFIMTEDTELISIDLATGQITPQVTFAPGVQEVSGRNTNVTIAANDGQMLVYFASSYQLFDFHFLPDG